MGILGIENRTENWKTARYFAPFFESALARARLVNYLLEPSAEPHKVIPEPIGLELFWQGMRDYEDAKRKVPDTELASHYACRFRNLRENIERAIHEKTADFQPLEDTITNRNKN